MKYYTEAEYATLIRAYRAWNRRRKSAMLHNRRMNNATSQSSPTPSNAGSGRRKINSGNTKEGGAGV